MCAAYLILSSVRLCVGWCGPGFFVLLYLRGVKIILTYGSVRRIAISARVKCCKPCAYRCTGVCLLALGHAPVVLISFEH